MPRDARSARGGLSVHPAQPHFAQWQPGLSKDVVISPFAFMVKCAVSWKTVPSLSRTVNVNVLFWFRSFRLKLPQMVNRPVRVGWVESSGTAVNVPVWVKVVQNSPPGSELMWNTPLYVTVMVT